MRKIIFLIYFISVYATTQTLYDDDRGIKLSYTIEKTDAYTLCNGSYVSHPSHVSHPNYTNKQINVWKVSLTITNGCSETIIPKGIGIANISVYPEPAEPFSQNYCRYNYVSSYKTDNNYLDQSLFSWAIREYKVEEIKSKETITNTAFLYLYEGQKPKLSNFKFLGYTVKEEEEEEFDIEKALVSSSKMKNSVEKIEKAPVSPIDIEFVKEVRVEAPKIVEKETAITVSNLNMEKDTFKVPVNPVDSKLEVSEPREIIAKKEVAVISNPIKDAKITLKTDIFKVPVNPMDRKLVKVSNAYKATSKESAKVVSAPVKELPINLKEDIREKEPVASIENEFKGVDISSYRTAKKEDVTTVLNPIKAAHHLQQEEKAIKNIPNSTTVKNESILNTPKITSEIVTIKEKPKKEVLKPKKEEVKIVSNPISKESKQEKMVAYSIAKAKEYKEKSIQTDSIADQKAYEWLALYHTYKCECLKGSRRGDFLVAIINNVVDSYYSNTDGSYEKIAKIEKCVNTTN